MKDWKKIEQLAGISFVALVIVGCAFVLLPFVTAILWAAIVCYTTWPLYSRLERLCRGRKSLAASLMTLLVALVMVVPFAVVGLTFADNLAKVADQIHTLQKQGLPPAPVWLAGVPVLGERMGAYWSNLSQNTDQIAPAIVRWFEANRAWFLQRSLAFGRGIFELIISVLIAFFFYRDGLKLASRVSEGIQRITGDYAQQVLETVGRTVKAVVFGLLGTALAQGILAGIGFQIAGIPAALLWALLTFFLSLIPFGPPLIWIPCAIWLFLQGRVGWGVFLLLWGAAVISGVDNLLRPLLISQGTKLPFVLILLGVLGGLAAFGFIGVFLGPTVLAVGYGFLANFLRSRSEAPADG